jgi:hypothetical protein
MKLLFDESLSPRLVELLRDLFPASESAFRNGLAKGDSRKIDPQRVQLFRAAIIPPPYSGSVTEGKQRRKICVR